MNNLRKQGIQALAWDLLGKLLTQASGFIVTIILARLLEPSDFGAIALIMVVVGITQVFSDVGLGSALIQRKKLTLIHYSSVFYFNIFIASQLALLTYLTAESIAGYYQIEKLTQLLQAASILFILHGLSSVQTVKLKRELNYRLLSKIAFSSSLISGIVGIGCALSGLGVWSLIAQILTESTLKLIMLWIASGWRPNCCFSIKALKQLWSFGFRMFLVGILNAITERIDYLVIGKLFSTGDLGFFQRAKSLNTLVIQYSSGSLMSVLFPVFSKIQNDTERFTKIVLKALNLLSLLVFLLIGCLFLSSESLIIFLYGAKWIPSIPFLQGLLLSAFVYPLNALLVNILSSRGNSKAFLKMALIKKTIFFTNLLIAFQWGITGYLYGLVVVGMLSTAVTIYFSSREIGLKQYQLHKPILTQILISTMVISTVIFLSNQFELPMFFDFIVKNISFVIFYIAVNFVIKTDAIVYFWEELSPKILKIKNSKKIN